jgi:hypothetical protein
MEFNKDWTKKQDSNLKGFHECNWEESCTMCQNFKACEDEYSTGKEKYENDELDKLEQQIQFLLKTEALKLGLMFE